MLEPPSTLPLGQLDTPETTRKLLYYLSLTFHDLFIDLLREFSSTFSTFREFVMTFRTFRDFLIKDLLNFYELLLALLSVSFPYTV